MNKRKREETKQNDNQGSRAIKMFIKAMESRKDRIQAQITFQDGPSGLAVVTAKYRDSGESCTDIICWWIHQLTNPEHGVEQTKCSEAAYSKLPMYLPESFNSIDKDGHLFVIEKIINDMYDAYTTGKTDSGLAIEALSTIYKKFAYKHPLEGLVDIILEHVDAKEGDLIFYHSFHGNASAKLPTFVEHIDFMPVESTPETEQVLQSLYAERIKHAFPTNSGSGNSTALENEYYNTILSKMPPMPDSELSQFVLGGKPWSTATNSLHTDLLKHGNPQYVIFPESGKPEEISYTVPWADLAKNLRRKVLKEGYAIVNPATVFSKHEYLEDYYICVRNAKREFEKFFNWAMFGRYGYDYHLPFDNRADPNWDMIRSAADCERITGNSKILNIGVKNGDVWEHRSTAQFGNGNVTISCGMGNATNFVRGLHWLHLSCHPFVVACIQALYNHRFVINCGERGRVKCGTGKDKDDKIPSANLMKLHTDTKCLDPSNDLPKEVFKFSF